MFSLSLFYYVILSKKAATFWDHALAPGPLRGFDSKTLPTALKWLDRSQFRIEADRLLEFLGYPALQSRGRTGRQNC
jgi:hypothetical protein